MSFLIERAKKDPKAFATLYETYADAVYNYCACRCSSQSEAEDLCSETWELALKNIQSLRSNHPVVFKAWLFKIAKSCLSKPSRKLQPLSEKEQLIEDSEARPDEAATLKDDAEALRSLVEALPEKQKETVQLHYFSGLRNKEIALLQETSEKTVASNLSRALDTLETWLKKLQ